MLNDFITLNFPGNGCTYLKVDDPVEEPRQHQRCPYQRNDGINERQRDFITTQLGAARVPGNQGALWAESQVKSKSIIITYTNKSLWTSRQIWLICSQSNSNVGKYIHHPNWVIPDLHFLYWCPCKPTVLQITGVGTTNKIANNAKNIHLIHELYETWGTYDAY